MNKAISPSLSSLVYPRVDQTASLIAQHGQGALIAKLDLHSTYQEIPVHPNDGYLFGRALPTSTMPSHSGFTLCLSFLQQLQTGLIGP